MKKLLVLALVFGFAAAVIGCGGSPSGSGVVTPSGVSASGGGSAPVGTVGRLE